MEPRRTQPLRKRSTTALGPVLQLRRRHRLAEPQRPPLRNAQHHLQKLFRRGSGIVERQVSRPGLAREQAGNERDRFLGRAFAGHGGGELWKARRLADDEAVQRERLRRQRGAEDDAGEPAQDLLEIRAGEERHGSGRAQSFDDAMEDGAEERRLVLVTG